jgi:AAHS family benzoate transporter-like MFS transporter
MKQTDVHKIIDEAKFNRFHWVLLFWCALVIIFDGYDLVIYGVVLPKLMADWNLTPMQAGTMGSYALFGMMFGAMFFGPLSDKIGRKKSSPFASCCSVCSPSLMALPAMSVNSPFAVLSPAWGLAA